MLTTHSPSHEAITRLAREIWIARGKPTDQDTSIWLMAERQLTGEFPAGSIIDAREPYVSFNPFGHHPGAVKPEPEVGGLPLADPLETAAKSDQLKHAASAPRLPTHRNAPRRAPVESGKPVWQKPHSS